MMQYFKGAYHMPKQKFTIAMLSNNNYPIEEVINLNDVGHHQTLDLTGVEHATLFIKKTSNKTPAYAKLFDPLVDQELFGQSVSEGAVLVLITSYAMFCISFGQGRHIIAKEKLTLDFGLKVVLNSVDPKQIRSLDKASNGKNPLNSRNQGINESNILELLFDPEEDIATSLTGSSKSTIFGGAVISGRDTFSVSTDCVFRIMLNTYSDRS